MNPRCEILAMAGLLHGVATSAQPKWMIHDGLRGRPLHADYAPLGHPTMNARNPVEALPITSMWACQPRKGGRLGARRVSAAAVRRDLHIGDSDPFRGWLPRPLLRRWWRDERTRREGRQGGRRDTAPVPSDPECERVEHPRESLQVVPGHGAGDFLRRVLGADR